MESNTQIEIADLLDLDHTIAKDLFVSVTYPWEVLIDLDIKIVYVATKFNQVGYRKLSENVWTHESCKIAKSAVIEGPGIIGQNTEIRHGAYIRGPVIIGDNCVIGNSTEIKNSILFNNVQAPHFNYIGDSILGYHSHLGAGAILSNLRLDKQKIRITLPDTIIETDLTKLGAVVGNFVEIGCNCVLNPGTIIGPFCMISPLSCVKGVVPPNSVIKR